MVHVPLIITLVLLSAPAAVSGASASISADDNTAEAADKFTERGGGGGGTVLDSTPVTKTIYRVFQTLPYDPSTLSTTELQEMERTIRSTQAMIFAPPSQQHFTGILAGEGITRSLQITDDNIEMVLDIYTPNERREYLVKRGNHCHPSTNSASGLNNDALNDLMRVQQANNEDTSLQWYDVLSRYDSLMASAVAAKSPPSSSSKEDEAKMTYLPQLERTAIELFKYCVLYNGDGHAYWGWDEQLLVPFRDVVNVDYNYGVVASSDSDDPMGTKKKKFNRSYVSAEADRGATSLDDIPTGAYGGNTHFESYIHESFLSISPYTPATSELSAMIRLLLEKSNEVLAANPLLLPQELRRLIATKGSGIGAAAANNANTAAARAGGKSSIDNNDSNSAASWTLFYNKCIPLANPDSTAEVSHFADLTIAHQDTLMGLSSAAHRRRMAALCPSHNGYCCLAFQPNGDTSPVMALHNQVGGWNGVKDIGNGEIMLPYKLTIDKDDGGSSSGGSSSKPHKLGGVPESDLVYISTVRLNNTKENANIHPGFDSELQFPNHPADLPNFFDILFENDCLPYTRDCHRCLKDEKNEAPLSIKEVDGGEVIELAKDNACSKCQYECPCYCEILCKVRPPPKPVAATYLIHPPAYRKEPNRLVPKIIHQTWFEPITKEKYPNMSRLIESWKKSGWEYYFYDDDAIVDFLGNHFPPEVLEAWLSLIPGAFKADLFRYCVLLIRGGVYADMDVFLQANLDEAITYDIGFLTPIDAPGENVGHRSCLWNGFIASAPSHPFLARTIEIVVNNIRNRFTSADYDDMLCPNPILSVSHNLDTLFTCGPCILGGGINNMLGRHMQTEIQIGDVDIWESDAKNGDGKVDIDPNDQRHLIPGRTVILEQNKNDMGSHRFTWSERHLIMAATDLPDYDDRPQTNHYSKTKEASGLYGLHKLYKDNKRANADIRIVVVGN